MPALVPLMRERGEYGRESSVKGKTSAPRGDATVRPVGCMGRSSSVSRSASRALDILDYVGEIGRPFRAIEVVRHFDLHPATVNQLLKTLVASSHLLFDVRRKTYFPSPRLLRFSNWMTEAYGPILKLHELLCNLREATGGVAAISTANGLFMQVLDLAGTRRFPGHGQGIQVSLFETTAIGDAYLSTLSDEEIERLACRARVPAKRTSELLAKISQIRCDGFADGLSVDGSFWSVAIPLSDLATPIPLVLGIADFTDNLRSRTQSFERRMRDAIACLVQSETRSH